ncbi:hypothetical protein OG426_16695 [Streptomyces canus]|uniref:hypothetical protein n=1 Tax=Streptomyces canus TaxID=58343 RepID=UPI00225B0926|nr:hypothetical protein [Streptomyces canus]MCX4860840.1 hypothetical protein [Streptomyces canus]WSW34015.1 hypothetical protein OG426_16695 [Streptomyces canus]
MHTRTLRRSAAGAVALTALLALSGCGSGDDTEATPTTTRRISDDQAAAVPDDQAIPSAKGSSTPSEGPVLPDSKITPVTGSFTVKEKKYLHGRVPENMDPAAVLQVGQDACQRIERTAAHDKDAAIGALIAGDVPSADDAIAQLCPKQKPLLDAAATGFADGTRKNPEPGTYRALTTADGCTWKATGAGDKVLASGPGPGNTKKVTAKIPAGTRAFVSSGCYAWLPA